MVPSRRAFVAAAAAAFAGCTGAPGVGPASDGESSPTASPAASTPTSTPTETSSDDCASGYNVTARLFRPADGLVADLEDDARDLVATAAEEGEAVVTSYRQPILDEGIYVVHGGRYYRTGLSRSSEEVTAFLLDISWKNGRTAPDNARVVQFDDLPQADRGALLLAMFPEGGERHPTRSLGVNGFPAPYPGGGDDSRLVGSGTVWVEREGRQYRVEMGERTTTDRHTYRYTVERIAEDAAGFDRAVAEQYLVRLDDQSATAADVMDAAIAGGHRECSPASDGLSTLLDRLPEDGRLPRPARGWFVAYEDDRYELSMLEWVH